MTWTVAAAAALLAASAAPSPIALPGGAGGIGFDDLVFARERRVLLVPAGRTGRLDLVDPGSRAVTSIAGFSATARAARGHEQGSTSADAGDGLLFAIDRTDRTVTVVDPAAGTIVSRARLGGAPDYVRWVEGRGEVWVTEPGREVIEIFRLERGTPPRLVPGGAIAVPGGPESLVVDGDGGRAYTNTFGGETFAIDVVRHAVAGRWPNGCRGARGIAIDAARGLVFVGCDEGRAVALDVAHGGRRAGEAQAGDGVDVIAYAPGLAHLYVPGAAAATLTVLGVTEAGALVPLGTLPTAPGAHCVAADDDGGVFVCDPGGGRLLAFRDPWPATR
jgi:hypothetical protein